jgi:hypothetical protein
LFTPFLPDWGPILFSWFQVSRIVFLFHCIDWLIQCLKFLSRGLSSWLPYFLFLFSCYLARISTVWAILSLCGFFMLLSLCVVAH